MKSVTASAKWDQVLEQLWRQSRFTSYFFQTVNLACDDNIPTLALGAFNRRFILFYNSHFVMETHQDHLIGLLIHEMLHVVLNHEHRASPGQDPHLQNLAQDMVINTYLKEHEKTFFSRTGVHAPPLLKLPPGLPMIPKAFARSKGRAAISEVTWEELFFWLKEQSKDSNQDDREAPYADENLPGMEDFQSGDGDSDSASEMEGLTFTDGEGQTLPTGVHLYTDSHVNEQADAGARRILHFIQKAGDCQDERAFTDVMGLIRAPRKAEKINWKASIKTIVDRSAPTSHWDYSYARFNRRYFEAGIYAPGRVFRPKPLLTVAVDVSGSMASNPQELELAFGVIEELIADYRVSLLCIDQELFIPKKQGRAFGASKGRRPYYYQKGDWRFIRTGSKGATFFAPLFNDYIKNHQEMLIVLTDGAIYDLKALAPYFRTLWVVSENKSAQFQPPFGKSITIRERS